MTRRATDPLAEAARESEDEARALGLEPTLGGEPTFTLPLTTAPEWRSEALGDDKRRRAGTFARALGRRLGAAVEEIPGRRYEGEQEPRWCLRVSRHRLVATIIPDPGVIELNVPPSRRHAELARFLEAAYDAAAEACLAAHRYLHNGRMLGSGGGAHVTIGGPTRSRSPLVRRPELLPALVAYACNHPGLSYAFVGLSAGATSQAPRADEAGPDRLRDLAIARSTLAARGDALRVEHVHATFGTLLCDLTGNTHRAEINVEKLATLGLVELRAVEAPPTARRWLAAAVLWRAVLLRRAAPPDREPLVEWGTRLHDEWALPARMRVDLESVLRDVGLPAGLLDPHLDHRYPVLGVLEAPGVRCEIRQALEFWSVIGPLAAQESAASRIVDSSTDRLEVRLLGARAASVAVLAAGLPVPTERVGRAQVGGVRYRASLAAAGGRHPLVEPQAPLELVLVDRASGRELARAVWHPWHPEGGAWPSLPHDADDAAQTPGSRRRKVGACPAGSTLDLLASRPAG